MTKQLSLPVGKTTGGKVNNITAVVPTRSGSERVKSKNTRPFAEKSLLEYKLITLLKLKENGYIQDIVVNSDCDESKRISEQYNVRFIQRDEYLASSDAPITDYWKEVLTNVETEHSMLCQCTSPLISYETYVKSIEMYRGKSLLGTELVKDYLWRGDESVNYNWPDHPKSQELSNDFWKINFGIVIISSEELSQYNNIKTPNTQMFPVPDDESLDIDNMIEFELAESYYED